jgi:group I intron endonuclease
MPKLNLKTGVYLIRNLINGKVYVGSASVSLTKRLWTHRRFLLAGTHHNKHLQAAWNKYGEGAFSFSVIQRCVPRRCVLLEQQWINYYQSYLREYGYNKSPTAGSPLGVRHTEATRAKVSQALKGKPKSDEHRKNMRKAKGSLSQDTINKMSAYAKNRSEEHRKKLGEAAKRRKFWLKAKWTDDRKRKIAEKAKARWAEWEKSGKAVEVRAKIAATKRERANLHG